MGSLNVNKMLDPVYAILGAILPIIIATGFILLYFNGVTSFVENLSTVSTGDATADAIIPVFATVGAIVLSLAFIGYLLAVATFRK